MSKELKPTVVATLAEIRKNVNTHITDGILEKAGIKGKLKRFNEYSEEDKQKLIKAEKPTVAGAVVKAVQPAYAKLGQINAGTKREKILLLGLEGAYSKDFNDPKNWDGKTALCQTGFWRGAFYDAAGGYGWVIEDHGDKGEFCYYTLPEGVKGVLYREKKVKAAKPAVATTSEKPKAKEKTKAA